MRLSFIVFLSALLLTGVATAQITITHTSIAGPGVSYTGGVKDSATFDVGPSGPGQTWTFSDYEWSAVGLSEIVEPSSTPYAQHFPGATRTVRSPMPGMPEMLEYEYESVQPTQWLYLGLAWVDEQADTFIVFEPPLLMAILPITYGSGWTAVRRDTVEFMGLTYIYVDSIVTTVDGWGTCNTPYGSHQVLRGFQHSWHWTTLNGVPISDSEELRYVWMNQQGIAVVDVQSFRNETNPDFTQGFLQMLGVPLADAPERGPVATTFSVGQNYPNPFNPTTSLPMALSKPTRITITIYDELGREVASHTLDLPAGAHTFPLDGSRWTTGTYFARVTADGTARSVKMNLVK